MLMNIREGNLVELSGGWLIAGCPHDNSLPATEGEYFHYKGIDLETLSVMLSFI